MSHVNEQTKNGMQIKEGEESKELEIMKMIEKK